MREETPHRENPPETRARKSQNIEQPRKPACILNKVDKAAGVVQRNLYSPLAQQCTLCCLQDLWLVL